MPDQAVEAVEPADASESGASEIQAPDAEAEVVDQTAPPDAQIDDELAGGGDAEPEQDPEQESQP